MNSEDLTIGIMFLSQTVVGILGNSSLLLYYLDVYCKKSPLKPTEVILTHLTIANFLIIVFKGIPETVAALALKQFFNDVGCHFILYVHRVGRSMSIGTICLLSVFQTITICPKKSWWSELKVKVQRHLGLTTSFCWILYLVINLVFPILSYTKMNSKNITRRRDFDYCSIAGIDELAVSLYLVLLVFPELLFSGLVVLSSSSMIVILYRHRQQIQHIRSSYSSSRVSPETRATQNILVLVSTFLTFYTLSSILNAYNALSYDLDRQIISINILISMSFSAFGSFVVMSHESTVLRVCFFEMKKTKSPNVIINV